MFRKIVSRLSFSPALVGQLSFYAKRLRKEQVTRRLGLVFMALALVVQSLTVFQAPESANAASASDFVYGGLGSGYNASLSKFLKLYDSNDNHLKDIFTSVGITRSEIASTKIGLFYSTGKYQWGRLPRSGQVDPVKIYDTSWNQVYTIYGNDMYQRYGKIREFAFIGYSKSVGWFGIMTACGNLVTEKVLTSPTKPETKTEAKTTPGKLTYSKSAINTSQGNVNATTTVAKPGDKITYKLTMSNTGGSKISGTFSDNLTEVLKYAKIIDKGGGTVSGNTIKWSSVSLGAGQGTYKTFTVQIKSADELPSTSSGSSCKMKNNFQNIGLTISIACPNPSKLELSKSAVNVSQGNTDAQKVTAFAGETIKYTLTIKNTGGQTASSAFSDDLSDVLEYATVVDTGGGTFDSQNKTISWASQTIAAGESVSKTFTVKVLDEIPLVDKDSDSTSTTDVTSYDCKMSNVFGSTMVNVPVDCSAPAELALSKSAVNVSQGNVDASTVNAAANDRITYTLTVKNTGGKATETTIEDSIDDILEYSTLVDTGGGSLDEETSVLSWPATEIKPSETVTRIFTVKLMDETPTTAQGTSDSYSYDCTMTNVFGTQTLDVPVECTTPKIVEEVVSELPHTGPTENVTFAVIALAVVTFFYFRSKQLNKEVRLIRKNLNAGAI